MKKTKLPKTLLFSLVLTSLLDFNNTAYANDKLSPDIQSEVITSAIDGTSTELLDNGDYIETVISSELSLSDNILNISTLSTSKTTTKTKTTYYKNSSGSVLWSVSIKATFTYNGSTSKCTNCSHSTTAPGKSWSIKSCTSSKSGNKATAKAIATHTGSNGSTSDISKTVTISCSPSGKVS